MTLEPRSLPDVKRDYQKGEGVMHLQSRRYGLVWSCTSDDCEVLLLEAGPGLAELLPTNETAIWDLRDVIRTHPFPNSLSHIVSGLDEINFRQQFAGQS